MSKITRYTLTAASLPIFLLAAALVLSGCGKDKKQTEEKRQLVLLCGSSFVKPAAALCSKFTAQTGAEVLTTTGGSEDLLPLVKAGQQGDIFITHDPYLDYVAEANALAGSVEAGFVAPVLAVRKGNPKGLAGIEDLTRPGLKVALSNPEYSTCGEMVFELLERKGIKQAVMKNVENRLTKGHSMLGTLLKTNAVDAVIMWNGVASTFGESLEVVPTAYEYAKEIRVHIIGLNYSKQPQLLKEFLQFATTKGPEIFAGHGYTK